MSNNRSEPLVGVLALQGAFEEHQKCLEAVGCKTRQVRTIDELQGLDGIVLPGGESTAMGLIGTATTSSFSNNSNGNNNAQLQLQLQQQQPAVTTTTTTLWQALQQFDKPVWGTCAGMILLAERCVGTSAVINDGQALIGGVDITVCRNYFGSQVSSFEMATPAPPLDYNNNNGNYDTINNNNAAAADFPGVFIRAPAILTAGNDVQVLGKVVATPCRQAAVTLAELERKIAAGENVIKLGVQDALDRSADDGSLKYVVVTKHLNEELTVQDEQLITANQTNSKVLVLPGAADGSTAREVICAVRKNNILCTAFHPELTDDHRWHKYFVDYMVKSNK